MFERLFISKFKNCRLHRAEVNRVLWKSKEICLLLWECSTYLSKNIGLNVTLFQMSEIIPILFISGSISKPSVLPPDPVEEALTPSKNKSAKKKKSRSNHENILPNDQSDDFSKIEMSLRLVCSMSGNYAKAW